MKKLLLILLLAGPVALGQPRQLTVKEFLKLSSSDTTSYVVKGVVTKVRSTVSGSFFLEDNTGTLLVYGLMHPEHKDWNFKQMDIVKGDTLTVLGRFTVYDKSTLEMKDGRLLAKADGPDHNLPYMERLDRKPSFKGHEGYDAEKAFKEWVQARVKTPEGCTGGTVYIKFVVGRKGGVQEVLVHKGVNPQLNAEAVRIVSSAPKWKPAMMDGHPIRMIYVSPVVFP